MKEWKASEKEAQKMTRDGAISVNMVTGEASHVSDRAPEQDYSPSGDSTALARTALHHLDDRRVRKSQKKKRRNRRKAYREGTAANSRPSSRLAQVTNWVKLKFVAMNLKKLATWKWKRKNPSPGKKWREISSMDFLSALIFFPFEMKKSVLA